MKLLAYGSPRPDVDASTAIAPTLAAPHLGRPNMPTAVDHRLTDQAVWAPTVDPHAVELVSARLRNYQFNPIWGFLADQVWRR